MKNVSNGLSNDLKLDEGVTQADTVLIDKNLAKTKGVLIGAAVIGVGWLATRLYKKIKENKLVETDQTFKPEENIIEGVH
jgi:hypothetical protein